jgi:myo-inositol-1(or 4)-monophosphatase
MAVDEEDPKMNTWFFMCGPLACNIFLLGFACNLFIFQRYELNIERIFDMKSDEVPTPSGVALFGCLLLCIQMLLFGWKQYNPEGDDTFGMKNEIGMESLLVLYALLAACLLSCPLNVFHKKCRFFLLRKIGQCVWPFQFFSFQLPSYPTPFVEVFIADGLTSLSKFFQDTTVALLLLGLTTSTTSYHGMEENLNEMYLTKMKHSPLPYLAASIPYM